MVFGVLALAVILVIGVLFHDFVWAPRALRAVRLGASVEGVVRALGPPDCREAVTRQGQDLVCLHFSRGIFRGTYVECVVREGVVVECSSHAEELF